jgi:peptide/nickel transport system ATP-binding protein
VYITHDLSTAYYISDNIATLYKGSLIEYGPARAIMDAPAHPYTELLMNAVPKIGDKWQNTGPMPEEAESGGANCKFYARCPYATDECKNGPTQRTDLPNGRMVLCNHPR